MAFAEILNQLKEFEKKFNEIKYPSEDAFQPSFSSKIRKAEQDSFKYNFSVYEVDEFLEKVEK